MHKVICNHPHGIQLRLLNGTTYLKGGETTSLTDVQMTHNSVKISLANGALSVVKEVAPEPVAPVAPVVEPKKPKAPKPVASIEPVEVEPTPVEE